MGEVASKDLACGHVAVQMVMNQRISTLMERKASHEPD